MIGTLRRQLRRIRYYSASSERTVWHRIVDTALYVTFFLGFVAAIVCDYLVDRPQVVAEVDGRLERAADGEIIATLIDSNRPRNWGERPVGEFEVQVIDRGFGWPLRAWVREEPTVVDLYVFAAGGRVEIEAGAFDEAGVDPEIAEATFDALAGRPDRFDQRTEETTTWLWPRWLVNAGMWWVMLYGACVAALVPARIGWVMHRRRMDVRARELRRAGRCIGCGYDVRGLEFHDRCPECGKLMT